jgi:long-subunit acyl-CoA synthetase (AMP-forming)
VADGGNIEEINKEEPGPDSILFLGVTSGTTGEPKAAMLTHLNLISG